MSTSKFQCDSGGAHFLSHPIRYKENFRRLVVPLCLHGDGTPAMGVGKSWSKQMDVWSWRSLLCKGPSLLTMILIFCVHASLRCVEEGHHTLETAFKKMRWSFDALYEGVWPKFDWLNNKLHYAKASIGWG